MSIEALAVNPATTATVDLSNPISDIDLDLTQETKDPDSKLSVAVGVANGSRTSEGGFTEKYFGGSDDEGIGTFNQKASPGTSPDEADRSFLQKMSDIVPIFEQAAQLAGLNPNDIKLATNFFDMFTEGLKAALGDGGFLDQLPMLAEKGMGNKNMVDARVNAMGAEGPQGNIREAQENRVERIANHLDGKPVEDLPVTPTHARGGQSNVGQTATDSPTVPMKSNPTPSPATPNVTPSAAATSVDDEPAPLEWKPAPSMDDVRKGAAMLTPGQVGPAVSDLQEQLNKAGANLEVDGYFGESTKSAVEEFQRNNKLAPPPGQEGFVGNTTLEKIDAEASPAAKADDVVFYSQNLNQYEPSGTCANTSMAMMMDTFGIHDDSQQRTPDFLYDNYGKVQDVEGMADMFNKEAKIEGVDVTATSTRTASTSDLREKAMNGEATVVGGYFTPNPGHFVVVTGYDEATDSYIVNDPRGKWNEAYNGTHDTSQSGQGVKYDASAFEDAAAPDGNVWMIEFEEN